MKAALAYYSPLPSSFTDELKTVYQKYFKKGFFYAVILHIFIIASYGVYQYYMYLEQEDIKRTQQRIINVTLSDLEPPPSATDEEELPPLKLKKS